MAEEVLAYEDWCVKLWHDDVRKAPEGWAWARTNAQAIAVFENGWPIKECSLDFDLGFHKVDIPDDPDELITLAQSIESQEDGADLVRWMIENKYVPPKIKIHSWNPSGAGRMAQLFNDAGYDVVVAPFA